MHLTFPRLSMLRIALIIAVLVTGILVADHAFAQVYNGPGLQGGMSVLTGSGGLNSSSDIKSLILKVVTFLLNIVLLLAILAVIIAGVYLIVSNGDEGQKDKAKRIVFYAVAGILLILFARVIVLVVNSVFG